MIDAVTKMHRRITFVTFTCREAAYNAVNEVSIILVSNDEIQFILIFQQFRGNKQFQVVMTERQEDPVDCTTSKEQGETTTLRIRNIPEIFTDQHVDVSFVKNIMQLIR